MSFFRTPIDPEVQKELFKRMDGINKSESYTLDGEFVSDMLGPKSEALENEYFKTCWARVVTIDGNGKEHYLNSQLGSSGKTPITKPQNYKKRTRSRGTYYTRGRAGITSISSNFKEFFLKQSTISFLCPDPEEFEEIQEKFLKHGRYVLVEFGWSTRKNIQLEKITTNNLVKFSNNLNQRTKNSRGNYAAICGVITNFSFNQKQDGSYEGTFEVSSMGRNILGQKIKTDGKIENLVNFVNEQIIKDKVNDDPETDEIETTLTKAELENYQKLRNAFVNFHATIKALPNVITEYVQNKKYKGKVEVGFTKLQGEKKEFGVIQSKNGAAFLPRTSSYGFKTPDGSEENLAYCTWGWFEDYILNSFFAFTSNSGDEEFKTRFFSTDNLQYEEDGKKVTKNESTKCKSNKNLFSLGLQSIILPGLFKQFTPDRNVESQTDVKGLNYLDLVDLAGEINGQYVLDRENAISKIIGHFAQHFQPFEDQGKQQGNIRNMVFEANYLIDSFTDAINIDHALMNFWQKVSNDYGGFWRFAVVQDDNTDGKIKIVDLNIGQTNDTNVSDKLSTRSEYINWSSDNKDSKDPGKIFRFPLYEKNSFIQDFSLETAYDSEMATMAVFGSNADMQATRGDMGQGYTELAVRALSLIQSKNLKGKTKSEEERDDFYDDVLKNLQVPVNTNPQQKGSSSSTDKNITIQHLGEGIEFPLIEEIQRNIEQAQEDVQQANQLSDKEKDIRKGYFWFDVKDETIQIYSSYSGEILKEFKRTMLYLINKSPDENDASNYNVVLPAVPLQLSLTIQGIGGIKIGDLFYVDYLPKMYREFCHWMVVGVEHEISTTGWTTKLDSRMIVDIPKLVEKYKDELTKTEFKPFMVGFDDKGNPVPGQQLSDKVKAIQFKIQDPLGKVTELTFGPGKDVVENPYRMINVSIKTIFQSETGQTASDVLGVLKSAFYRSIIQNDKLIDSLNVSDVRNVMNGNPLGPVAESGDNITYIDADEMERQRAAAANDG